MKEEFSTRTGKYIGLSPKCYFINDGKSIKRSHKGVPKSIDLDAQMYEHALFNFEAPTVSYNRITMDSRLGSTTTKTTKKRGLNVLYSKLHVKEDLVSIRPHCVDGKYL